MYVSIIQYPLSIIHLLASHHDPPTCVHRCAQACPTVHLVQRAASSNHAALMQVLTHSLTHSLTHRLVHSMARSINNSVVDHADERLSSQLSKFAAQVHDLVALLNPRVQQHSRQYGQHDGDGRQSQGNMRCLAAVAQKTRTILLLLFSVLLLLLLLLLLALELVLPVLLWWTLRCRLRKRARTL